MCFPWDLKIKHEFVRKKNLHFHQDLPDIPGDLTDMYMVYQFSYLTLKSQGKNYLLHLSLKDTLSYLLHFSKALWPHRGQYMTGIKLNVTKSQTSLMGPKTNWPTNCEVNLINNLPANAWKLFDKSEARNTAWPKVIRPSKFHNEFTNQGWIQSNQQLA